MALKLDYLHFDSIYSTDTNNDSFDTTFTLNQKYKNIKKIYLKNAEIPIGFPNIRTSNGSNFLSFVLNGVSYNAIIPQQNFTTITTLLTALNSSISTLIGATGFTLVFSSSSSNNIIITSTGSFST